MKKIASVFILLLALTQAFGFVNDGPVSPYSESFDGAGDPSGSGDAAWYAASNGSIYEDPMVPLGWSLPDLGYIDGAGAYRMTGRGPSDAESNGDWIGRDIGSGSYVETFMFDISSYVPKTAPAGTDSARMLRLFTNNINNHMHLNIISHAQSDNTEGLFVNLYTWDQYTGGDRWMGVMQVHPTNTLAIQIEFDTATKAYLYSAAVDGGAMFPLLNEHAGAETAVGTQLGVGVLLNALPGDPNGMPDADDRWGALKGAANYDVAGVGDSWNIGLLDYSLAYNPDVPFNPCQSQIDMGIDLSADFNGDCYFDFKDIHTFAGWWLAEGCDQADDYCDGTDIQPVQDGNVNFLDFAVTASKVSSSVPVVSNIVPSPGSNLSSLTQIEVTFSEPVESLAAQDLVVESSSATQVTGSGPGPYTFSGYAAPAEGLVNVSLDSGDIKAYDFFHTPFAGDSWDYTIQSDVQLISSTSDSFVIRSGVYTFEYTESDELLFVTRDGQGDLCLATGFARDGMYDFLKAAYVSNVSAVDYTDRIEVNITGSRYWADYVITLNFYKNHPGMMRYRCEVDTLQSKINDDTSNPDWRFYNKNTQQFITGNVSDYTGPYAGGYQWGRRYDALCYFYESDVIQSQVFLKADLTSMDDYYLETGSDPTAVTTANNSEFGVKIPYGQTLTPVQRDYTLYDCYLYLTPDQPANNADAMVRFVDNFGDSYRYMQKPATSEYTDWPTLAIQMAMDVTAAENWGDPWWVNGTSKKFPLPYVDLPHKDNKEIIPNAGMLLPLTQYEQKWGPLPGSIPLIDGKTLMTRLTENMVNFYTPNWLGTGQGVTWNNPGGPGAGDVDAWYYVYPNMQMASFALTGDSTAYNATLGSIGRFVDVGIAINYEYKKQLSVYYKTASGYHENDSNGSFIYHMMQLYQLTGNTYYLSQAMLAAPHVADKGLDLAYEIHMTAASFAGLMWLYDVTGDATYLEYAYTPLANLLFHSWVWENDYGYAIDYRTFWLISATPGNPISAQFEEAEIWRYVYEGYLKGGEDLSPKAQALISEMIKWKMMASKYSLPPFLGVYQ